MKRSLLAKRRTRKKEYSEGGFQRGTHLNSELSSHLIHRDLRGTVTKKEAEELEKHPLPVPRMNDKNNRGGERSGFQEGKALVGELKAFKGDLLTIRTRQDIRDNIRKSVMLWELVTFGQGKQSLNLPKGKAVGSADTWGESCLGGWAGGCGGGGGKRGGNGNRRAVSNLLRGQQKARIR